MQTYEEVGKTADLDMYVRDRFVRYMRKRWADQESLHCQVGYAQEWAERFRAGIEYVASDLQGQRILDEMACEA